MSLSSLFVSKKRLKFQTELTVDELVEVSFSRALMAVKVRQLDGGNFRTSSQRVEVRDHRAKFNMHCSFPCKMAVNTVTGILGTCRLRLSIRMEDSGGHCRKVGFVDINLAEYGGSGPATVRSILQSYRGANHRLDNSILQFTLNVILRQGDTIFQRPSASKLSHSDGPIVSPFSPIDEQPSALFDISAYSDMTNESSTIVSPSIEGGTRQGSNFGHTLQLPIAMPLPSTVSYPDMTRAPSTTSSSTARQLADLTRYRRSISESVHSVSSAVGPDPVDQSRRAGRSARNRLNVVRRRLFGSSDSHLDAVTSLSSSTVTLTSVSTGDLSTALVAGSPRQSGLHQPSALKTKTRSEQSMSDWQSFESLSDLGSGSAYSARPGLSRFRRIASRVRDGHKVKDTDTMARTIIGLLQRVNAGGTVSACQIQRYDSFRYRMVPPAPDPVVIAKQVVAEALHLADCSQAATANADGGSVRLGRKLTALRHLPRRVTSFNVSASARPDLSRFRVRHFES